MHDIVPTHLHVDQGDAPRLAWTVTTKTTAAVSIFQPAFRNVNRIAITKVESNKIQCETAAVITYKALDTFRFIVGSPPYMTNVSLQLRSPSKDPTYDRPENPLVFMRVGNNHWCHSQCQALSLYPSVLVLLFETSGKMLTYLIESSIKLNQYFSLRYLRGRRQYVAPAKLTTSGERHYQFCRDKAAAEGAR